jgi:hypothetical protein
MLEEGAIRLPPGIEALQEADRRKKLQAMQTLYGLTPEQAEAAEALGGVPKGIEAVPVLERKRAEKEEVEKRKTAEKREIEEKKSLEVQQKANVQKQKELRTKGQELQEEFTDWIREQQEAGVEARGKIGAWGRRAPQLGDPEILSEMEAGTTLPALPKPPILKGFERPEEERAAELAWDKRKAEARRAPTLPLQQKIREAFELTRAREAAYGGEAMPQLPSAAPELEAEPEAALTEEDIANFNALSPENQRQAAKEFPRFRQLLGE